MEFSLRKNKEVICICGRLSSERQAMCITMCLCHSPKKRQVDIQTCKTSFQVKAVQLCFVLLATPVKTNKQTWCLQQKKSISSSKGTLKNPH